MKNLHNEDASILDAVQKSLYAHTEGYKTIALGNASHAEGQETKAMDNASHAQGRETIACGKCSHAQGFKTKANADYSVAMGCEIEVTGKHSIGIQLNKEDENCLSQANTMAIMGGKVGVGTLCPTNDFEVDGNVGFVSLPTNNPQVAGTLWNYNGSLRVSNGQFVDFEPGLIDTAFGEETEITLESNFKVYNCTAASTASFLGDGALNVDWQVSCDNGLSWMSCSYLKEDLWSAEITNIDKSMQQDPESNLNTIFTTTITLDINLLNLVFDNNDHLFRVVVTTDKDAIVSNSVLVTA